MLLKELLQQITYIEFIGNSETEVDKLIPATAENEDSKAIMWLNAKGLHLVESIKMGTIVCSVFDKQFVIPTCNYIVVENPRIVFAQILSILYPADIQVGISKSANIDSSVKIGKDVFVGENVVIEKNCIIGDNVKIGHNTVLKPSIIIEKNVIIGSNNTIGGIGFGYEKDSEGNYQLIPHIGGVYISENVEIGNNTCIDRAVMGNTFIGKNVKIDNLVHIAHGVEIGENTVVIANSIIGGSTKIGKNVWVAPSASIINKITIGDNSLIGLGAVVVKNVDSNAKIVGNPGKDLNKR